MQLDHRCACTVKSTERVGLGTRVCAPLGAPTGGLGAAPPWMSGDSCTIPNPTLLLGNLQGPRHPQALCEVALWPQTQHDTECSRSQLLALPFCHERSAAGADVGRHGGARPLSAGLSARQADQSSP